MGSWWEKIWADRWVSALVFVLVLLLGTFLAVLFCGGAAKFIVQLFGVSGSPIELAGSPKYEALKFLGIGMGGAVLALQAAIANKRAQAMENTAKAQADTAKAQAKATDHQAQANETTEKGQRQERLKNAIEHLGHESDSVRLGGAYELFHLARDTPDLRQTVLDILCAHIRRTTREPKYKDKDKYSSNPSEEIQSLLTLLFVQEHKVFTGLHINLQESWLNGSNLNEARLEKANLRGAQLHGAHLIRAQLHGAWLVGAQLHGAWLSDAQLHEADLFDAQLHGARLEGAQLHGAHLERAQLHEARLFNARLYGAYLVGAQLHGAHLAGAQLQGAHLAGAQLQGAYLMNAHLHGASCNLIYPNESFEAVINKRIGKQSDLSGVIFAGGLTPEAVASIGKGLPDEDAKRRREWLKAHIGKPESHEFPEKQRCHHWSVHERSSRPMDCRVQDSHV